ncbi:MAG: hypothetical protein EOO75_10290 [Myxococcales bacterium]|nr:MAG: hypothetical protein EOO75_10290 [Myxococcales bacterium]
MIPVPAPLLALASELAAELGPGRVGLLATGEGARSPAPGSPGLPAAVLPAAWPAEALTPPARVLPAPVPMAGKLARGSRVSVDGQPFVVQRISPVGHASASHEHLVVWLSHGDSGALAWVLRERRLKRLWLQGWFT